MISNSMRTLLNSHSIPVRRTVRLAALCSFAACTAIALFTALPAVSQAPALQPRITAPIDNTSRTSLTGTRPPRANPANDAGEVPGSMPLQGISLVFSRTAAQQTALDTLVAAQQNPASPLYHRWITPAQYAAQFGVADADIAAAETWLQQQGFTVDSVSRSRNRIYFSGTAAQVASAFAAPLHYYLAPATATQPAVQHFAPSADLTIPSALASSVLSIGNLTDFRPHSHLKLQPAQARPLYTVQDNQAYLLTPPDVETIYDVKPVINQGFNGAGQTIAVVGQSDVPASDITTFQALLGLPAKAPSINLVPGTGTSATVTGDETEADLDLEYSSALAPGATVNFYYTGNNQNFGALDALQYVVDNDLAPIISNSFGDCEFDTGASNINEFDSLVLEQAAAQGETVLSSAGDDGSTDCAEDTNLPTFAQQTALAVDYPASSPFVTAMGGTEFPVADVTPVNATYWASAGSSDVISTAITYIPEQVWNDDAADVAAGVPKGTNPISSGGGGISLYEPRPTYQANVPGIPAGSNRLVPDISLAASPNFPGYLLCTSDKGDFGPGQTATCVGGFFYQVVGSNLDYAIAGGTSFDAPIFSGLLALINQAKGYTTGQGVINSTLYSLASNPTTYASAFHDITSGGNQCLAGTTYCGTGDQTTEFAAGTGYDEASGLGSVDFSNLVAAWPASPGAAPPVITTAAFALSATNVTVAAGSSTTGTIAINPGTSGYTGTVNLTLSPGTLMDGCISISPTSVTVTNASAVTASYTVDTSSACTATSAVAKGQKTASLNPAAAPHRPKSPWKQLPVPAALAGTLLLACFRRRSRLLRSGLALGLLLALSVSGLGLTGCGGNSTAASTGSTITTTTTDTPANTYTFTVTGADSKTSTTTASATFTITVS
jgi:subtilase family serine protease